MPNIAELIDVFEKAGELVSREGNDFAWSSWEGRDAAIVEINAIVAALCAGDVPTDTRVLFLPTGPLQELSLISGWGDDCIALANCFDEALQGVDCICYTEPVQGSDTSIGTDSRYADIFVTQCPDAHALCYDINMSSNSIRIPTDGSLAPCGGIWSRA